MFSFKKFLLEQTHAIDKLKDQYGKTSTAEAAARDVPKNEIHNILIRKFGSFTVVCFQLILAAILL